MTLLDTNVIIDAQDAGSPFRDWAREQIAAAVAGDGAAINAVILAELSAGRREPEEAVRDLRTAGVEILDLPAAAAAVCGAAYRRYCLARQASGAGAAPKTPLPDFFIGAHAQILGGKLATRDGERFKTHFPGVVLVEPAPRGSP